MMEWLASPALSLESRRRSRRRGAGGGAAGRVREELEIEAPTREPAGRGALCHLAVLVVGRGRSLAALRDDALEDDAPAALAPPWKRRVAAVRMSSRTGTRCIGASRRS